MSKILVLGANGQLGADLVRVFTRLPDPGVELISLTRDKFDALTNDVRELEHYRADYIINCIATTQVDAMEDNSNLAFNINTVFVHKLAEFCYRHNIILIHISTDYVFDGTKKTKYTEDDTPNPLNIYGLSKYAGELAPKNYHDKYFIFRVSSLFGISGASGKGGNFVTMMQRLGKEKDEVKVITDQFTCPTATIDIARCIYYFIQNRIMDYGIYNCVSSNSSSWLQFTEEIFRQSNLDVSKVKEAYFNEYPFKAKRPQYGVLDTGKLSRYYVMPKWQDSLKEYIDYSKICCEHKT